MKAVFGHPAVKGLLRVGGSAIALYIVVRQIDLPVIATTLQRADWRSIGAATGLFTLSKLVGSQRLNLFFAADGLPLSPSFQRQLYWLGMFYNLLLPGGVGGDGYKAIYLHRKTGRSVRSLLVPLLLDRVAGLLILVVLIGLGVAVYWSQPLIRWPAVAGAIGLPWLATYVTARRLPAYRPYVGRVFAQSLLVQGLQCGSIWLIGLSLQAPGSPLLYCLLFLVSTVLATLPISIGGAGIRELTFLSGAEYLHLSPADAVSISLIFYAISAVISLTGGYYAWVPPVWRSNTLSDDSATKPTQPLRL